MIYDQLRDEIQSRHGSLIAVSKTKPIEAIELLYQKGQRDFGENRVQELISKYEKLPKDIRWHMIGRLQRNKVKYIVPFVALIHSVDSLELLQEIDKQSAKLNRKVDCLLQFHIARESTKAGFSPEDLEEWSTATFGAFTNVRICGVMGMATFTEDEVIIRSEFQKLRKIFESLQSGSFKGKSEFKEISMGMSDDYKIALEEGSTMVRVGTLLFGER